MTKLFERGEEKDTEILHSTRPVRVCVCRKLQSVSLTGDCQIKIGFVSENIKLRKDRVSKIAEQVREVNIVAATSVDCFLLERER